MEFTISLSDIQYKSLAYAAYDPEEWIKNAVYERCRLAMEEIYTKELDKINSEGKEISGTKYDIIMNADIKSAKEQQDELDSLRESLNTQLSSNPTE